MILESLREALGRMADTPALWIAGLYPGTLIAVYLLIQDGGNPLFGARIGFLGLCALPFFLGGSYGAIRSEDRGLHAYLGAGGRYFFRILLAGVIIVSAALLAGFLVMVPAAFTGGSLQDIAPPVLLGVGALFAFFTFFTDTAVVFEDRKVLDSIRRSVGFVAGNPLRAVAFYLAGIAAGALVFFASVILWLSTSAGELQPLLDANQTSLQNMTPTQLVNFVGPGGIAAAAGIGFVAFVIWATFLLSFKACFFRRAASAPAETTPMGEFDEKGRWYRY